MPVQIVLIVDDDDIAEFLELLLGSEGYDVARVRSSEQFIDVVHRRQPDLLVVELPPHHENPLATLDLLRLDPAASRIPVLVVTTLEPMTESAKASYNVRRVFTPPFEVEDLTRSVSDALGKPPLRARVPSDLKPQSPILAEAERILAERSRNAVQRWAKRLEQEAPWQGREDLTRLDIIDDVPVLVEAVIVALHYGNPDEFFDHHPDVVERVRDHVQLRRDQGVPLPSIVREYIALRDELVVTLFEGLPKTMQTDDVRAIQRALNGTLDRLMEVVVPTYLEPIVDLLRMGGILKRPRSG